PWRVDPLVRLRPPASFFLVASPNGGPRGLLRASGPTRRSSPTDVAQMGQDALHPPDYITLDLQHREAILLFRRNPRRLDHPYVTNAGQRHNNQLDSLSIPGNGRGARSKPAFRNVR